MTSAASARSAAARSRAASAASAARYSSSGVSWRGGFRSATDEGVTTLRLVASGDAAAGDRSGRVAIEGALVDRPGPAAAAGGPPGAELRSVATTAVLSGSVAL